MAEKKKHKADRDGGEHGGRRHNSDFSRVLRGPHYWISVKTKDGRVVRIPVEGKRRKAAGKTKASKATVRSFKGTQGRDVVYRAKGVGGASKPDVKAAGRGTVERIKEAKVLRAARKRLTTPPPSVNAISAKQRKFAEDVRADSITKYRKMATGRPGGIEVRKQDGTAALSAKDRRKVGTVAAAHEWARVSARDILDSHGRKELPALASARKRVAAIHGTARVPAPTAPVKPAGPSLREQAAAHRAAKGAAKDRARALAARLSEKSTALRVRSERVGQAMRDGTLKTTGLTYDQAKAQIEELRKRAKKRMKRSDRVLFST